MSRAPGDSAADFKPHELRLDRLLGRRVVGRNNEPVGRIEEFRAVRRGTGCVATAYVIGGAGLLERLGVGMRLLLGRHNRGGYVARWDQIDVSDPERPRLTCSRDELQAVESRTST
jgi:hypothetical protein